jgi:hypothetical protein
LRWRREVAVGFAVEGSDMMEGRRGRSPRGGESGITIIALGGSEASWSEFVDDWADGSVRDNFFIFLGCFALLEEINGEESESDVAEDSAEAEESPSARAI